MWAGRSCQEAYALSEDAVSVTPERVMALCPHSVYTARTASVLMFFTIRTSNEVLPGSASS